MTGRPNDRRQDRAATALVMNGDCGLHDTGWGHPEHQGRLPAIVNAIYRDTPALLEHVLQHEARHATEEEIRRVHHSSLVENVRAAAAQAARTKESVPLDAETIVSSATWEAALAAAGCAVEAVDIVVAGRADSAFALCRPPGHHATPDRAMGFCLFNNIAVAARHAQAVRGIERVLIVDWDVHHGNGTQDIFYEDGDVFFLSLHQAGGWPGTGTAAERGSGAGTDATLNVPLPAGIPRDAYLAAFARALDHAFAHRPDLVLVSAGYDCLAGDPLGGFTLEPEDLHAMTETVLQRAALCRAGVVVALEGGYAPRRVGSAVVETLHALSGLPVSTQSY